MHFVFFLPAFGNDRPIELQVRGFFVVLNEAESPAFCFGGDLRVDSLDFIKETSLSHQSLFQHFICGSRQFVRGLVEFPIEV